jgi:hypothetical protein
MPPKRGAPFGANGAAAIGTAASTCLTPGRRATASTADDEYVGKLPPPLFGPPNTVTPRFDGFVLAK